MGNKNSQTVSSEISASTTTVVSNDGDENKERGNWSGKLDFILSCLGYAVGLGNVWRFPYLTYKHGGAVFLIPYALSLLLIGIPIFFMELSIGQYTSSGPLTCWKMAPLFQGLGGAMLVISCVLAIYYNMIIGWSIYYLVASFTALPGLPWQSCQSEWATPFCETYLPNAINSSLACSQYIGANASAGAVYVPFPDGLCIGMPPNASVPYDTWFIDTNSPEGINFTNASNVGTFMYNDKSVVWAPMISANISGNDWVSDQTSPLGDSGYIQGLVGLFNNALASQHGHKRVSVSDEYFNRKVLKIHESEGIEKMGAPHWDLALCLLAGWLIVFLCLIKGIKSSGKVVYFTALFPYAVLLILLSRGALLSGSLEGVLFYIRGYGTRSEDIPENPSAFYAEKLGNIEVWKDAAEQIFFSLSACYGGLIALSSYNRFNTNAFRDTMIVTFGNCLTSFFAGFVIFSYLGHMAENLDVSVANVTESGITLAFVVYPAAVLTITPPPLWAILFFLMLLTLGLDSEFALMETILTSMLDVLGSSFRPYKTPVIAALCSLFFLMGLSMTTSGGLYMLNILDTYGAGWNVLIIAVLEAVCVGHQHGFTRFTSDIQTMIGSEYVCFCVPWRYFRWFWMLMWCIVTPLLCLILFVYSLVNRAGNDVFTLGSYVYSDGSRAMGWCIFGLVLLVIVLGAIIALVKAQFNFYETVRPTLFWGPALPEHRKLCTYTDMHPDPANANQTELEANYETKADLSNNTDMYPNSANASQTELEAKYETEADLGNNTDSHPDPANASQTELEAKDETEADLINNTDTHPDPGNASQTELEAKDETEADLSNIDI